jgi:hypothetical protein
MRLLQLQANGEISITQNYRSQERPEYAILSHTWEQECEEVNLQDIQQGRGRGKLGYEKLEFCGNQAKRDGLQHFWVDTCCIDKASSSELTESINSMFNWYKSAKTCYVYLTDVTKDNRHHYGELYPLPWEISFEASRWFTRGWTLQELLAPSHVEFFSKDGQKLGDKTALERIISRVTGIPSSAIFGRPLSEFQVEERLSWSNNRTTSREEDKAYSLLGILDMSASVIYGEGYQRALERIKIGIQLRKAHARGDLSTNYRQYFNFPQIASFEGRPPVLTITDAGVLNPIMATKRGNVFKDITMSGNAHGICLSNTSVELENIEMTENAKHFYGQADDKTLQKFVEAISIPSHSIPSVTKRMHKGPESSSPVPEHGPEDITDEFIEESVCICNTCEHSRSA